MGRSMPYVSLCALCGSILSAANLLMCLMLALSLSKCGSNLERSEPQAQRNPSIREPVAKTERSEPPLCSLCG